MPTEPAIIFLPHYKREFPFTEDNITLDNANLVASMSINIKHPVGEDQDAVTLNDIIIRGPGDILGFNKNLITRFEPPEGHNEYEPNYFVFVESPEEDFFWRYSIVAEHETGELALDPNTDRIIPWLTLIVLEQNEINAMEADQIDVLKTIGEDFRELLTVRREYLPSLENAWAYAHVQVKGLNLSTLDENNPIQDITTHIERFPHMACSRLLCLQKLEPERSYIAFIVPTYKVAVKAYLGEPTEDIGVALAWEDADDIVQLPVYHKWSFWTSERKDFEMLARELKQVPIDPDRIGTRAVDPALELPDIHPTDSQEPLCIIREGALAPPNYSETRKDYSETVQNLPITEKLIQSLNANLSAEFDPSDDVDPLVTYPVYGKYFKKTTEIKKPKVRNGVSRWQGRSPWVHEINLDFRGRIAAAFGTTAVQRRQDEYSRECWYQYGDIRTTNQLLRQIQIGTNASVHLEHQHFNRLPDEHYLMVSSPAHSLIITEDREGKQISVKKFMDTSGLPKGSISPTLRKLAYKKVGVKNMNILTPVKQAKRHSNKFLRFLKALWLLFVRIITALYVRSLRGSNTRWQRFLAFLVRVCAKLGSWFNIDQPRREREEKNLHEIVNLPEDFPGSDTVILKPKAEIIPIQKIDIKSQLREKIDVPKMMLSHANTLISFNNPLISITETFDPIMVAPKLDNSMYKPLAELSHDYILPGIEFLEKNCVSLCEENRRFIEAYMVGLNHEMGRELVWREFPTDQRGTIFCYFWDSTKFLTKEEMPCECYKDTNEEYIPQPDIKQIHRWNRKLSENQGDVQLANLVLIIKGDLIRRYPGTIIYAQKITARTHDRYKFWLEVFPRETIVHRFDDTIEPILDSGDLDRIQDLFESVDFDLFPPFTITKKPSDTEWDVQDTITIYRFRKEGSEIKLYNLTQNPDMEEDEDVSNLIHPVFRASIGSDILFVGFPFSLKDIEGPEKNGEYYFVLQENQDLPRFGLDVQSSATRDGIIGTNDLSWSNVSLTANGYISDYPDDLFGLNNNRANSSSIADKTYQKPFRIAIHSSQLLEEVQDNE